MRTKNQELLLLKLLRLNLVNNRKHAPFALLKYRNTKENNLVIGFPNHNSVV